MAILIFTKKYICLKSSFCMRDDILTILPALQEFFAIDVFEGSCNKKNLLILFLVKW